MEEIPSPAQGIDRVVEMNIDGSLLEGHLVEPDGARGLVVFVHGSGSGRNSRRNLFVARMLRAGGMATLLFDLLTREEQPLDMLNRRLRFDIPLLAGRVVKVTDWLFEQDYIDPDLRIGYFGSSTGAAAALVAAAQRPERVYAVVSRGGRPDLAMDILPQVKAYTLLITGGDDPEVVELNRQAYERLSTGKDFQVIPGAGHLFEEPGKLEEAARMAYDWFSRYLLATEPVDDAGA